MARQHRPENAWTVSLLDAQPADCILEVGFGPGIAIEMLALPLQNGEIAPAAILAALAERGMRRILIEGGSDTLSRFVAARCLDRLHVLVAPIILGAGRASLSLPALERVTDALRVPVHAHVLGSDILLDCDLSAQRVPIGYAKQSI